VDTTPSTASPVRCFHIARISSAERGKCGVNVTSCAYCAIFGPNTACSSAETGRAGLSSLPMVPASPWAPMVILPWSACTTANAPGMPPVARSSALFWKIIR